MKGGTVQINWHGTKPVLTLDFHPFSGLLATGGADFDIKVYFIYSLALSILIHLTCDFLRSFSYIYLLDHFGLFSSSLTSSRTLSLFKICLSLIFLFLFF